MSEINKTNISQPIDIENKELALENDIEQIEEPTSELFSVIKKEEKNKTIFVLQGELDFLHKDILNENMKEIPQNQTVVLDLRELNFMDSTGIRQMMKLFNRSQEENWNLEIIPGNETIQRIFVLCGLDRYLPFVSV